MILSGTDTYTGGTTVSTGTLLINAAGAFPGGTSLTVGAGGILIFNPSSPGTSSVSSVTTAASVTANAASSIPASSETAFANVVKPGTPGHDSPSLATTDAVFASHRSALDQTVSPADDPQSAPLGMARGNRKHFELPGPKQGDRLERRSPGQGSCPFRSLIEVK